MQQRHLRSAVTIVWLLACLTGVVLLFTNVPTAAAAYADVASLSDTLLSIRLRRAHRVLWIIGVVLTVAWLCWAVIAKSGMRRVVATASLLALTLGLWLVARSLPWSQLSLFASTDGSTMHYVPEVRGTLLAGTGETGLSNPASTSTRFWLHVAWLPLLSLPVLGLAWSRRVGSDDATSS